MVQILLLEDEFDEAVLFQEFLREAGHEVQLCTNADDALTYLKAARYDLVITDLFVRQKKVLTHDGGLRVIGTLRLAWKRDPFATPHDTPIIAVTGASYGADRDFFLDQARTLGANVTLHKPVMATELHAAIARLMGPEALDRIEEV